MCICTCNGCMHSLKKILKLCPLKFGWEKEISDFLYLTKKAKKLKEIR